MYVRSYIHTYIHWNYNRAQRNTNIHMVPLSFKYECAFRPLTSFRCPPVWFFLSYPTLRPGTLKFRTHTFFFIIKISITYIFATASFVEEHLTIGNFFRCCIVIPHETGTWWAFSIRIKIRSLIRYVRTVVIRYVGREVIDKYCLHWIKRTYEAFPDIPPPRCEPYREESDRSRRKLVSFCISNWKPFKEISVLI